MRRNAVSAPPLIIKSLINYCNWIWACVCGCGQNKMAAGTTSSEDDTTSIISHPLLDEMKGNPLYAILTCLGM